MMIDRLRQQVTVTAVLAPIAMLAACSGDDAAQVRAAPEPVVVIETVTAQSVPNIVELPGRIEAVRTAEVRARVDGIVQRRLFEEGSDVREGDVLFKIDPRQKQARLAQAEAQLARMIATRDNALQVVNRYAPLVARRAVSAQENDAATATLRQAEADVAQARAVVDNERLERAYTTVRAPLTGRVGKAAVTEGALVSAASATLLTRIDQLNPVYVSFTQSSSDMIDLRERLESGAVSAPAMNLIEVRLILANGSKYGPVGHLDFADLAVDPSTGSQIIRARFDNAELYLLPGQFVRGRISAGVSQNGISVPQRAVRISEQEASVMLVGADGVAVARPVEPGTLIEGRWVISTGLKPGDQVIVEGWQKVRPGQKVQVRNSSDAAADNAPASSGSGP